MSKLNRVQLNPSGLSRQSTRTYKAIRQKSNADLDNTLRQLKLEHKASISKILQEEYDLKNVQNSLKSKKSFKGDVQMSACAGSEEELEEGKMDSMMNDEYVLEEKPTNVSKMASFRPKHGKECHKKRHHFHLPSILEENSRCFVTQAAKTAQCENILPPLFEFTNPSYSRGYPEGESERCRSKTISIPDETREGRRQLYVMRKRSNDGRIASNTKRKDQNSPENDSTSQGWGEEMTIGARHLRRSYSSPNVFDI
ncbi:uncharacterized protein LOC116303899 [Actinia tenebrosa]|uniref:Uncharacterized protein LOC116303899 n=1 Tax=Actinia tenebrosa TaxID=6105 RepID=A0A6P8IT09_ACTTE|nr:uncharacterized protein LOC116303899 [Actinia tenebrosa]